MELVIVMSLILIIAVMSDYGRDWLISSRVESQTRQILTDLMNARASAMQRNHIFFVSLAPNQYTIKEDTDPPPDGDGNLTASDN